MLYTEMGKGWENGERYGGWVLRIDFPYEEWVVRSRSNANTLNLLHFFL